MNDDEESIGELFRTTAPWASAFIYDGYVRTERIGVSRDVFEGLRLFRVHILPQLFSDHEPGDPFVSSCIEAQLGDERTYCARWRAFHAQNERDTEEAVFALQRIVLTDASLTSEDRTRKFDAISERFRPSLEAANVHREFWAQMYEEICKLHQTDYELTD